jgi:hypothetical protein
LRERRDREKKIPRKREDAREEAPLNAGKMRSLTAGITGG